jgi:peptide/nickel transport system ATP-binding protein
MYAGRIVESASTSTVLTAAEHPYAQGLVRSTPTMAGETQLVGIRGRAATVFNRGPGCAFVDRCDHTLDQCATVQPDLVKRAASHSVACWNVRSFSGPSQPPVVGAAMNRRPSLDTSAAVLTVHELTARYGSSRALSEVSVSLDENRCLAIVGESGSGKSTLARCLIGLHNDFDGRLRLSGEDLAATASERSVDQRRRMQYIFQNPYSSLNPRATVEQIVAQPIVVFEGGSARSHRRRVADVLELVALDERCLGRLPGQLSGGERQRVAIARALVAEPDVLICDEITSALDVSVQASIVNLLDDLRRRRSLSIVFITHNLPVVRTLADDIVVLRGGVVVERGTVTDLFERPTTPYTRQLVEDTPAMPTPGDMAPTQTTATTARSTA